MWQQTIAILIIFFIIYRQFHLRKKNTISIMEFRLWLIFWVLGILVIMFIKKIDLLVEYIGFSSSGINVILYMVIILLFYFIFKLRIKIEKIEKNMTEVIRNISLDNKK
jgi:small membrane protein